MSETVSDFKSESDMSPEQCRAARALLRMEQGELAERSGIARTTVIDFEAGSRRPQSATLFAIRAALEAAGVEFIEENGGGPGVRLRKPGTA
jgi:transcriptional regulator with XRE-family HTH domain